MYPGPFGSSLELMGGKGLRARGPRLLSQQSLSTGKQWKKCVLKIVDTKVMAQRSVSNVHCKVLFIDVFSGHFS